MNQELYDTIIIDEEPAGAGTSPGFGHFSAN